MHLLAVAAGLLLGLSLGALGGGGSVLAVPVLVYLLDQTPAQATTGSLVVVGVTSVIGAVTTWRRGGVLAGPGLVFGAVAVGGAVLGARASAHVSGDVLMAAFSLLLVVVAGAMVLRRRRGTGRSSWRVDEPIITFRPSFACACPRALKVLVTATLVGALTGFLGVGGGFLVVPALVLALGLPVDLAAGTSLVVISVTSAAALAVRAGSGPAPAWGPVVLLTLASVVGATVGARVAGRLSRDRLQSAFLALLLVVSAFTAVQAVPALMST